jgi:hypothetical protein
MYKLKYLTLVPEALTGIYNHETAYPRDVFQKPAAPPFAQCIPEQLEHFQIMGCHRGDLGRLTEFVETLRNGDRFLRLQSVRFSFDNNPIEKKELKGLYFNNGKLTVKATN